MKFASIFLIQRPKNNARNGDTMGPHIQRTSRPRTEVINKLLTSFFCGNVDHEFLFYSTDYTA
jgi:hypothetical protein